MSAITTKRPPSGVAPDNTCGLDDTEVVAAFKSPLTPRPSTAVFSGKLTLRQTLLELQRRPPKDDAARRLVQQLQRETSGPHDVLVVGPQGELTKVDPETTTLAQVAVPREVRSPRGTEKVPTAAFEVQAYAPVGLRVMR